MNSYFFLKKTHNVSFFFLIFAKLIDKINQTDIRKLASRTQRCVPTEFQGQSIPKNHGGERKLMWAQAKNNHSSTVKVSLCAKCRM